MPEPDVRVHLADTSGPLPDAFGSVLDDAESKRAARFLSEPARRGFVVGRVLMRTVLAELVGVPASELRIGHGPYGKPHLSEPSRDSLHFSLAHSGDLAALAASRERPIGIDLERVRAIPGAVSIAERYFGTAAGPVRSAEAGERDTVFLRQWTALEARAKATGSGIAAVRDEEGRADRGWHVLPLPLPPGFVGALAVEAAG